MTREEWTFHMNAMVGRPYFKCPLAFGSPTEGFNCAGLFRYGYQLWGIYIDEEVHRSRRDFVQVSEPRFLDGVLFGMPDRTERHLGIMLDEFTVIHATEFLGGVARSDIAAEPWSKACLGFFRHRLLCS